MESFIEVFLKVFPNYDFPQKPSQATVRIWFNRAGFSYRSHFSKSKKELLKVVEAALKSRLLRVKQPEKQGN